MNAKSLFSLLKDTYREWSEDNASMRAAAMSYYTAFSLAPLLVIAIAIAGIFLGRESVQDRLLAQAREVIGSEAAGLVETMVERSDALRGASGLIASAIALATLLLGAAGVFQQLRQALNHMWGVAQPRRGGIVGVIKQRLFAFALVLGAGSLLLLTLVASAALSLLTARLQNLVPGAEAIWQIGSLVLSFGLVTLLFALLYKLVPDAEVAWGDVWVGAAFTALLFIVGQYLIGLYLGRASVASAFGAAGSLIILLLWIYYSAQILFFGAEFTQVYAARRGSRANPDAGA
ncbi:MAG: YihY/virulence factor BrkB family protein [Anaerolineae bacterium]|nr:YihY/virulence factor BrkB family protein [Anaerolineae bacterium]